MTAYVVAGLAQAKAAGVQVDADRMENGKKWIAKTFAADPKLAFDLRAYMQYALAVAGGPDANGLGQVFDQRAKLSPYGLAILGLALETVKDARAAEIAGALEQAAQQDSEQAWWPADARPDAGFLRRRDARGDGVRGEVPLPSASRFRAASQGGAVADESSQRRLLVEQHQADRDGDLRADRLPEGDRRIESQFDGDGAGERCPGAHEEARSGGGDRCCRN